MKKILSLLLKVLVGVLALVVLGAIFLVGRWMVRHEDPLAYVPEHYVAFIQAPSLRSVYDEWLSLPVADVVLSEPELRPYRGALADARGLALTRSPLLRHLIDVHADIVLLPGRKILAVLDLGWRGIFSPLAGLAGPVLSIKGFSFLHESGTTLYRFSSGTATVQAALRENVAVIALDDGVIRDALARRAAGQGIASLGSRDLVDQLRPRSSKAIRILADTQSLSTDLLAGSQLGARLLGGLQLPGQSTLEAEARADGLRLSTDMPISPSLPELAQVLSHGPQSSGVLRYVPSTAYLLSVVNLAPLDELYRLAAALEGQDVQEIYKKADDGARSLLGMGMQDLLFSWVGSEIGAFQINGSEDPVFFARITDRKAFEAAVAALTGSAVAGKDNSLVLDGVRVDKLTIPWYVGLVLGAFQVNVPETYFLTSGDYVFASLDAGNLAAVSKTAETGDNIARSTSFARLTERVAADSSLMVWYDSSRAQPFFLSGSGVVPDVLRLFGSGVVVARASSSRLEMTVVAASGTRGAAQLLPGFPLTVDGGVTGDVLAFRFADSASPLLAWIRDRSTLVLADARGERIADSKLETDSVIVPEQGRSGTVSAIWAVSPSGTVWRFGPRLEPTAGFPVPTAIASPMPPTLIAGRLALFSRVDSTLVLVSSDGSKTTFGAPLDAPLLSPPDAAGDRVVFYPKSFDAKIYVRDLSGTDVTGWPVAASGISFCAPRFVSTDTGYRVVFLTQAGALNAWDATGGTVPGFPVALPGVYYATPQPLRANGGAAVAALAQDGTLSVVGMDGRVLARATVADMDGKQARVLVTDLRGDGQQEILLYGSGAFIAGYDASLRVLPGFPLKGVTRPQVVDLNHDGRRDLVTAGLDGRIYAYALEKGKP